MQEHLASQERGEPLSLPEDYKAVEYENRWDPKLVIPAAENIKHASTLGLPVVEVGRTQRGKMIVVCSAPSVEKHIDKIREFKSNPANKVFTVNRAHGLMMKHGIEPDGALVFEIEKRAYEFLEGPSPNCTYYICSICDAYAFDQLKNNKVFVWHCHSDLWVHKKALIEGFGKFPTGPHGPAQEPLLVGGGFTTFLRTLTLGYVLGFRDFELFGVDSSFHEDEKTHFFGKPDYGGLIIDCFAKTQPATEDNPQGLKKYRSMAYLVRQADEFRTYCEMYSKDFKMRVWGEGLLPDIHRFMQPQMYEE